MQPYQERVVQEKKDLDEKLGNLESFIEHSTVFPTLDSVERAALRAQLGVMQAYSLILGNRIDYFNGSSGG